MRHETGRSPPKAVRIAAAGRLEPCRERHLDRVPLVGQGDDGSRGARRQLAARLVGPVVLLDRRAHLGGLARLGRVHRAGVALERRELPDEARHEVRLAEPGRSRGRLTDVGAEVVRVAEPLHERHEPGRLRRERAAALEEADPVELGDHPGQAVLAVAREGELRVVEPARQHLLVPAPDDVVVPPVRDDQEPRLERARR